MMYPIDGGKLWEAGTVEDKIDDRSYQVRADHNDNLYRRNRIHLRPVLDQPEQNEPIPENIPNKENEQVPEQNKDKTDNNGHSSKREKRPPYWMKDYVKK